MKTLTKLSILHWLIFQIFCIQSQPTHAQQMESASIQKASQFIDLSEFEEADKILMKLKKSQNPTTAAQAHRLSAQIFMNSREFNESINSARKALELSTLIEDRYEQSMCYYLLSRSFAMQSQFDSAKSIGKKGSSLARHNGFSAIEYDINNILDWSYFMLNEDFNVILVHEERLYETANNNDQKANIRNNLGYNLTVSGTAPLDSVSNLILFANDHYAQVEDNEGRWYTLMNMTWVHRLQGKLKSSMEYGRKSAKQAIEDDDRHAIVEANFQWAESLFVSGNKEKADSLYNATKEIAYSDNDRDRYVFDVYYQYHKWRSKQHDDETVEKLSEAINFLSETEVFYEMVGRVALAEILFYEEKYELAMKEIAMIETPRHNYISFEIKCLAALLKSRLMTLEGSHMIAKELLDNWASLTKRIGANYLTKKVMTTLNQIQE